MARTCSLPVDTNHSFAQEARTTTATHGQCSSFTELEVT